jgi:DNA-binding transcriptional ArsR family regulator
VKTLEPIYKTGARHGIILFLTGWLYKAGISYESAEALVKAICDNFKDEECNDRLYTLRDTYGIGKAPREERIKAEGKGLKTKGGLYDWIVTKAKLNEETALAIVKKLEEILETPEPTPSVIIERMNYEKEVYAIVNFRRCEVLTAMRKENDNSDVGLIYKDRVILGCPESVTAIVTPFSQIIKYDIVWYIPTQKRRLPLEGVTVDEILAYLKANGLVLKKYQAEDVLNAILNAMLRKGLADIKTGFDAPGFYWVDGKLIANKVDVNKPDSKELKEALELLNELANVWFINVKEQFVTVLKLGLLMPFSFAIKQKFRGEKGFLPWLYIFGQRDTGKTTTAEILLYIFNIMNRQHELGVGEVNTEAKLGAVLSSDTFPHIINEGASLFDKPNLNEIVKQAVEGLIARQRFESKSIIKEYPAFAPLIITANEFRITDEALAQKRLVVLRYPITAKVTKERIAEFHEKVANRLPKLRALGQFVVWYLVEHPEELTYDWLNLSKKLLEEAYKSAGIAPGFDLGIQYIDMDEADPRLDIIAILWKKILEAYNKKIEVTYENGNYSAVSNPLGILESVLESHSVDFMIKKNNEVLFTSKVIQLLRDEGINIDSMNALAELFADYKFEYAQRRVMGKKMKVLTVKNEDLVNLFYDFFKPEEEDKNADNAQKDA